MDSTTFEGQHRPYRRGERRRKSVAADKKASAVYGAWFSQHAAGMARPNEVRGVALVVEAEAPVRWRISTALVEDGYSVVEAATAAQAEEVLKQIPVDVLLLDLDLPKNSSWTLLRGLAYSGLLSIPVIVLPAGLSRTEETSAMFLGMGLPQPLWLKAVVQLVQRISPAPPLPGVTYMGAEASALEG